MSTIGQFIDRVYNAALGGRRAAAVNVSSATLSSADTFVGLIYPTAGYLFPGATLEIDDEQMLVTTPYPNGATVMRGWHGTTAADHDIDAVAFINPTIPRAAVSDALSSEIQSLPPLLFAVTFHDIGPTVDGQLYYEVASVVDASDTLGGAGCWIGPFTGDTRAIAGPVKHRVVRHQPAGLGVMLADNPGADRALRFASMDRFDTSNLEAGRSLVDDIGLDPSWIDIVEYGVCHRLLGPMEMHRALADRVSTGADLQAAQPGQRQGGARWYASMRQKRMTEAAMDLRGRFPFTATA